MIVALSWARAATRAWCRSATLDKKGVVQFAQPSSLTSQGGGHRTRVGRERRQRTGLKLLQAVFDAIDDDGLERLGVDRVKATARLSRGSFYNYASTLDELLATVADLIWRQVHTEQVALFDMISDPIERRCSYLRYGVGRSTSDKTCGLVLLRSLPRTGTFSLDMRRRHLGLNCRLSLGIGTVWSHLPSRGCDFATSPAEDEIEAT